MYDTHTPAEWAAAGSLGLSAISLIALALAFADADAAYFDPRPAVRKVHQATVHAGHDVNRALATGQRVSAAVLRDAAISLAALLMLLSIAQESAR